MKQETQLGHPPAATARSPHWTVLGVRGAFGGLLMGLANLVPGISGGTMLLAAGVYPRVIAAVAELSTLRFRFPSLLVLGSVLAAAIAGILAFAGPIKDLVIAHRWIMYSLFVGLTLGGLPVVWNMARPGTRGVWMGAAVGFLFMVALALGQRMQTAAGAGGGGPLLLFVAGLAGAAAMILPGVSGGYILLVMRQYLPILAGIEAFKDALAERDLGAAFIPGLHTLLPVGIGVVVGIVVVSNLLKLCLARYEKPTLGVLIGLLLGAVVGLWPFQKTVDPVPGVTVIKGQVVTRERLTAIPPEDYPTATFQPTAGQVAGAIGLILLGAATTLGVSRLGGEEGTATGRGSET